MSRSLFHSLIGVAGARAFGALTAILAARLLGPTLRGQYALAFVIASCVSLAATGGLQFWASAAVSSHRSARYVSRTVFQHLGWVSLAITAIGIATAPLITDWLGVSRYGVASMIAYAVSNTAVLLVLAIPNGDRRMGLVSFAMTTGAAVVTAGLVVLAILDLESVALVLFLGTIGNIVAVCIAVPSWRRIHATAPTDDAGPQGWGDAVRRFFGSGLGEVAFLGMLRIDLVVIAAFLPLSDVGLYTVAVAYAELLWVVPDAVAQLTLPLGADREKADLVPRIFRLTMATSAVLGVMLAIAAPVLVPLVFGADFSDATSAVPMLAVASLFAAAWKVLGGEVAARGNPSVRLWSALAGMVSMLAIDVMLVPAWGIAGAAAGSAAGYLIAALGMGRAWARLPGREYHSLWLLRRADFAGLGAARLGDIRRRSK